MRSPISFQEFTDYIYDDAHTGLQRDEFLKRHLGSRVTWTGWAGSVYDHRQYGISMLLAPKPGSDSRFVAFLTFPQSDRSALLFLGFRQKVTVDCALADCDPHAELKECKLIKVWPGETPTNQAAKLSSTTFEEFVKYIYKDTNTQLQLDHFVSSHLGTRVTWTGWVEGVADKGEDGISVMLAPERHSSGLILAFLTFPRADRTPLISLGFGQKITANCILTGFDSRPKLKECKLIKTWPKS